MSSLAASPPPLSAVLDARLRQAQRVSFAVTQDWLQGRTAFGGFLSAISVQAMRDVCGAQWPLRALQTNFVGPVGLGSVHVDVTLLRQGKHVRQVKAEMRQVDAQGAEQVCGVLLGVFGSARTSQLDALRPVQPAVALDPNAALPLPFIAGLTPNFTQHLAMRLAEGALPFSANEGWQSRFHVRLKSAAGIDAELAAIVLADAGPTPVLSRAKEIAPASSVSWALELRPVHLADDSGWWRLDQDTIAYDEGYANDRAHLWTPDGQLAALGYQVVAIYA